jgi:hypothetical protein
VEAGAPVFEDHAGVMPCGDELGAEARREREQLPQLHGAVARDAGAGRLAVEVGVDEGADDVLLEQLAPIEGEVGDADDVGDAAGVVLIFGAQQRPRSLPSSG